MRKRKQNFEFAAEQLAKFASGPSQAHGRLLSRQAHYASGYADALTNSFDDKYADNRAAIRAHGRAARLHLAAAKGHKALNNHDIAQEHLEHYHGHVGLIEYIKG